MGYQRRVHGNLLVTLQLGTQNFQTNKQLCKMRTSLVTTCLLWLAALASAKFCPGEKDGNKCAAGDNSYKCAVFFENLTPKRNLTWIGALPDALKKARNKEEIAEILGADVTQASFKQLFGCDNVTANARCYTIVSKTNRTWDFHIGCDLDNLPGSLLIVICCSWTSSGSCPWTPVTGTSSTPAARAQWATICAGRSGGGSGGARTSRKMESAASDSPSTTAPVAATGLRFLTATTTSMLMSLSAVIRTENSLDATGRNSLKLADKRGESFSLLRLSILSISYI